MLRENGPQDYERATFVPSENLCILVLRDSLGAEEADTVVPEAEFCLRRDGGRGCPTNREVGSGGAPVSFSVVTFP